MPKKVKIKTKSILKPNPPEVKKVSKPVKVEKTVKLKASEVKKISKSTSGEDITKPKPREVKKVSMKMFVTSAVITLLILTVFGYFIFSPKEDINVLDSLSKAELKPGSDTQSCDYTCNFLEKSCVGAFGTYRERYSREWLYTELAQECKTVFGKIYPFDENEAVMGNGDRVDQRTHRIYAKDIREDYVVFSIDSLDSEEIVIGWWEEKTVSAGNDRIEIRVEEILYNDLTSLRKVVITYGEGISSAGWTDWNCLCA